jgi:hypothetical protein
LKIEDSEWAATTVMRREGELQGNLLMTWAEMPRSPGHVFYDRLQELLSEAGFDAFVFYKLAYDVQEGGDSVPADPPVVLNNSNSAQTAWPHPENCQELPLDKFAS